MALARALLARVEVSPEGSPERGGAWMRRASLRASAVLVGREGGEERIGVGVGLELER